MQSDITASSLTITNPDKLLFVTWEFPKTSDLSLIKESNTLLF